jgi:hypothetical protein
MSIKKVGASGIIQEVDAVSQASRVGLYSAVNERIGKKQRDQVTANSEYLPIAVKNDDISIALRGDRKGNVLIGNYIPELLENYEGATVNVQKWTQSVGTFSSVQSTLGGYNFNNAFSLGAGAFSILQSQRAFSDFLRVPLHLKHRMRVNIPTNSFMDFGLGIPSTTTLIVPNGVAVRCVNGLWSLVMTFNSVELVTSNIVGLDGITQLNTSATNSEYFTIDLIKDDDNLVATVQNTQTGQMVGKGLLALPLSALKMFGSTALPTYVRLVNSGTPATAPNLILTNSQVLSLDWALNPDVSQLAGSLSLSAGRNPFTGAQTENHTNSTAPLSATLANATAGYATLGGKYQFVTVAGSVTDYVLFGFQVPVGSRFLCESVTISARNEGAAVATTATELEWAMGFNSLGVSLATGNIVRKQIPSQQVFPIAAVIGATVPNATMKFDTPEVTESGRFVSVILNLPVGTATAAQIIRGQVTINGRFI